MLAGAMPWKSERENSKVGRLFFPAAPVESAIEFIQTFKVKSEFEAAESQNPHFRAAEMVLLSENVSIRQLRCNTDAA